jgi:hypothetical protein
MFRKLIVIAVLVSASAVGATALAGGSSDLKQAKKATAPYQDLDTAKAAGYGLLLDAAGIACIDMPGQGAMGIHYVNGTLVGDATVDAKTPEAVVYEPQHDGRLKLVALEYVVFQSAWDAKHSSWPSLFGQRFDFTRSPNRYGLPAFYSLHAWIWKHNPAGTFAMWNPRVSCTHANDDGDNTRDNMDGMDMGG